MFAVATTSSMMSAFRVSRTRDTMDCASWEPRRRPAASGPAGGSPRSGSASYCSLSEPIGWVRGSAEPGPDDSKPDEDACRNTGAHHKGDLASVCHGTDDCGGS